MSLEIRVLAPRGLSEISSIIRRSQRAGFPDWVPRSGPTGHRPAGKRHGFPSSIFRQFAYPGLSSPMSLPLTRCRARDSHVAARRPVLPVGVGSTHSPALAGCKTESMASRPGIRVVVKSDVASQRTVTAGGAEVSRELASALDAVVVLVEQGVVDAETLEPTVPLAGL